MSRVLLLAGLLLSACNSPHPIDGLRRSGTAEAGGHSFHVNWNTSEAQATRTNATWRPGLAAVTGAAVQATEEVTGCSVVRGSAIGDIALIRMRLDCG
ncbi:hypothetical protein [Jannaschia sp. 2305UL9-9]|uniref:hypothetical protein n=1 Tax=Jannaschia sp. 2305UL9-9 TaxID=3121638 RepID=UPI0035280C0D